MRDRVTTELEKNHVGEETQMKHNHIHNSAKLGLHPWENIESKRSYMVIEYKRVITYPLLFSPIQS